MILACRYRSTGTGPGTLSVKDRDDSITQTSLVLFCSVRGGFPGKSPVSQVVHALPTTFNFCNSWTTRDVGNR